MKESPIGELIEKQYCTFDSYLECPSLRGFYVVQKIPILAAGAILFRIKNKKREYLLVKHRKRFGGHWNFPKGQHEMKESFEETAQREIKEETGLRVKFIKGFNEKSIYSPGNFPAVRKTVHVFLAEVYDDKKITIDSTELEDYAWISFSKAVKKITYESSKELLKKAEEFLK